MSIFAELKSKLLLDWEMCWNNTKIGIIIGFYLRALRIWSSKYLDNDSTA